MNLREEATKLLNNEKVLDRLSYLKERWNDEKKYESFEECEKRMKETIEENSNFSFVEGIKKPFGVVIQLETTKLKLIIKNRGSRYSFAIEEI